MENNNKHWSDEEKQFVIDSWGDKPLKRIAKEIGRTENAIIRFAERNKLGGAIYDSAFLTTVQASEIIGVDQTTIISWITKKELKATTKRLRKRKIYLIDPDTFRNYLKNNQDKWDSRKLTTGFIKEDVEWLMLKREKDLTNKTFRKSWTIKEELLVKSMIKEGKTIKEIAEKLNRSIGSVRRKRENIIKEMRLNNE